MRAVVSDTRQQRNSRWSWGRTSLGSEIAATERGPRDFQEYYAIPKASFCLVEIQITEGDKRTHKAASREARGRYRASCSAYMVLDPEG